jgi:hypothetical protein
MLNQDELNKQVSYLKKIKYKNILQELKLEYTIDEPESEPYIYLVVIKIKKSQQCKGYGSAVISEITKLADEYHVNIVLFATNIFGAELKRLYGFYRKHGFVLIKKNNDGKFVYRPEKNHVKCNKIKELSYN